MADAAAAAEPAPSSAHLLARIALLETELALQRQQRQNERAARIRVQRQLRSVRLQEGGGGDDAPSLLAQAVGTLHSCFSRRNGTPRQPGLVPAARSALRLRRGVPGDSLFGLEEFSHVWVIYVFHANTDLHRTAERRAGGALPNLKSRVSVPRLDGETRGVFATRTPHRPTPVGLSLGKVVSVDISRSLLVLEGLDLVDGSPVLDIKPFLPFCDAPAHAITPPWVGPASDPAADPLRTSAVLLSPPVAAQLWQAYGQAEAARLAAASADAPAPPALYASAQEFGALVSQVLSLDIRSLRQRTGPPAKRFPLYHVILCCVEVDYQLDEQTRGVTVLGGRPAVPERDWEKAQDEAAAAEALAAEDEDSWSEGEEEEPAAAPAPAPADNDSQYSLH